MVTGGYTDTTETFAGDDGAWTTTGARLPRPMEGLRAATIDDRVLIFGNYTLFITHKIYHRNILFAGGRDNSYYSDDILEYDPDKDSMIVVGRMSQDRGLHAVSVVQAQDFSVWCQ